MKKRITTEEQKKIIRELLEGIEKELMEHYTDEVIENFANLNMAMQNSTDLSLFRYRLAEYRKSVKKLNEQAREPITKFLDFGLASIRYMFASAPMIRIFVLKDLFENLRMNFQDLQEQMGRQTNTEAEQTSEATA